MVATESRAVLYHLQVIGREKNRAERSHKLGELCDLNSVVRNVLLLSYVVGKAHCHVLLPALALIVEGDGGVFLAKTDYLRFVSGAKALAERNKIDRLKQICFSLRVFAVEHVDATVKFNDLALRVAKILQFNPFTKHISNNRCEN